MQKIKLPSNEVILYALALAGALTFMYSLTALDGASLFSIAGVLSLLRGLVVGAVAGLGMAKIAHALPRANKTNRPYILAAFIVFLCATMPLISAVTFARMSSEMLVLPLWVRIAVAISAGALVDSLTAGVAFASGKLEADEAKPDQVKAEIKPVKVVEQVEIAPAAVAPVFACANCGREFATQNALNAHERSHKPKVDVKEQTV